MIQQFFKSLVFHLGLRTYVLRIQWMRVTPQSRNRWRRSVLGIQRYSTCEADDDPPTKVVTFFFQHDILVAIGWVSKKSYRYVISYIYIIIRFSSFKTTTMTKGVHFFYGSNEHMELWKGNFHQRRLYLMPANLGFPQRESQPARSAAASSMPKPRGMAGQPGPPCEGNPHEK